MTVELTYYTTINTNFIYSASLAYTKVLMVAREGVTYDILVSNNDIAIGNRQVLHQPAYGALFFSGDIPFNLNETVNIVYETNP